MARLRPGEVGPTEDSSQVRIWSKAELQEATWSCGWARRQGDIWVLCRSQRAGMFESPETYIKTKQCKDKLDENLPMTRPMWCACCQTQNAQERGTVNKLQMPHPLLSDTQATAGRSPSVPACGQASVGLKPLFLI